MAAGFSIEEKTQLLNLYGVGETVIQRLEEIGIHSFEQLKVCSEEDILNQISSMLNSSCWKNSPQSKIAIKNAVELAQRS